MTTPAELPVESHEDEALSSPPSDPGPEQVHTPDADAEGAADPDEDHPDPSDD